MRGSSPALRQVWGLPAGLAMGRGAGRGAKPMLMWRGGLVVALVPTPRGRLLPLRRLELSLVPRLALRQLLLRMLHMLRMLRPRPGR